MLKIILGKLVKKYGVKGALRVKKTINFGLK